jgi:hypothetical protein
MMLRVADKLERYVWAVVSGTLAAGAGTKSNRNDDGDMR